jgi:hypothetical protein
VPFTVFRQRPSQDLSLGKALASIRTIRRNISGRKELTSHGFIAVQKKQLDLPGTGKPADAICFLHSSRSHAQPINGVTYS